MLWESMCEDLPYGTCQAGATASLECERCTAECVINQALGGQDGKVELVEVAVVDVRRRCDDNLGARTTGIDSCPTSAHLLQERRVKEELEGGMCPPQKCYHPSYSYSQDNDMP